MASSSGTFCAKLRPATPPLWILEHFLRTTLLKARELAEARILGAEFFKPKGVVTRAVGCWSAQLDLGIETHLFIEMCVYESVLEDMQVNIEKDLARQFD